MAVAFSPDGSTVAASCAHARRAKRPLSLIPARARPKARAPHRKHGEKGLDGSIALFDVESSALAASDDLSHGCMYVDFENVSLGLLRFRFEATVSRERSLQKRATCHRDDASSELSRDRPNASTPVSNRSASKFKRENSLAKSSHSIRRRAQVSARGAHGPGPERRVVPGRPHPARHVPSHLSLFGAFLSQLSFETKRRLSASDDARVHAYDVERSTKPFETFAAHSSWVLDVAAAPDGRHFATCGSDRSVKIWDLNMKCVVTTLETHADQIWSLAYSPDGTKLVSASDDASLHLYNAAQ